MHRGWGKDSGSSMPLETFSTVMVFFPRLLAHLPRAATG